MVESFVDVVADSAASLDDFHAIEGRTARLLGCSAGTVKSQTSRGLARLRVYFADQRAGSTNHREDL
ncbi:MAG: hypothetical protein M3492_13350 [Actinomycetota bacterium]|nr:hypothetical protein [Actinomycetota bacterium]